MNFMEYIDKFNKLKKDNQKELESLLSILTSLKESDINHPVIDLFEKWIKDLKKTALEDTLFDLTVTISISEMMSIILKELLENTKKE